ncbi:MAG: hypothetical protein O2971_05710 [Proteobacteria bacterium]|nr:hypothetical protein [Pseudomonadota bacterium]
MVALTLLDITLVDYDSANPRISPLLENFDNVDHSLIGDALQPGDAPYLELKQAIRSNKGLINPIIVEKNGERFTTIEGNTRLAIYKKFCEDEPNNEIWQAIPAMVHDNLSDEEVHAIRLQAHLVGVRNWTPFAKAKYLYELYTQEQIPPGELVDFCGGNKHTVMRNIAAYQQMNTEYRNAIPEGQFDDHKFSLFFNAQKPKISAAISGAGFTKKDFIQWVVDGKFEPRQEYVRDLPAMLENPRAREVFLTEGAKKAISFIDRPELVKELLEATLEELCYAVQEKIRIIQYEDMKRLREDEDAIQCIEDTCFSMQNFFDNELVK